jgi:hypothetical protein
MLEALGFKPGQRGKRSVSCVRDRVNECYEKSTQEAIRSRIMPSVSEYKLTVEI